MKAIDHGLNLQAIRHKLDREEWEESFDSDDMECRRVYLGSIFSITPSGKVYAPFACSNVDSCSTCKGRGSVAHVRRRVQKRRASRVVRTKRIAEKCYRGTIGADSWEIRKSHSRHAVWRRASAAHNASTSPCTACDSMGSREAAMDQAWNQAVEDALHTIGASLDYFDDGIYAIEWRDAE